MAMAACSDLLTPSAAALAGTWRSTSEPAGNTRLMTFTGEGQYVVTLQSRGGDAAAPDSVTAYSSTFGAFQVVGATLHLVEDSTVGWNWQTGSWRQVGPGFYIEGPPTDPTVQLTATRLVLTNAVNPGGGYVPMRREFRRAP